MAILDVRGLTYAYDGGTNVLHDVSFSVAEGSVVGLVGPNGSGKSTLIKNVFDLLESQTGEIVIGGHPHVSTRAKEQSVYLASNDYLPEFLTGREFVSLVARLFGVKTDHARAEEYFRAFSMRGRYDDLIADYSHGMRKKTQLISAFLVRRPLTVVDETLNGIDLEALRLVEKEFQVMRSAGCSILLCSHDFAMLERVTDSVVFLDLGRVIADEPTAEIVAETGGLDQLVFGHLESEVR